MKLTGSGLGTVQQAFRRIELRADHLHMEYFWVVFEIGIIGIILVINLIKEFFSIKAENKTELTLKAVVLGFLVSCCFNFPAHLWLPATWAMACYSMFYTIKNEELIWLQEKK